MKRVLKGLAGVAAIASLSFPAPSYAAATVIPTARIIANRTPLELQGSLVKIRGAVFAQRPPGISAIFQVAEMQFGRFYEAMGLASTISLDNVGDLGELAAIALTSISPARQRYPTGATGETCTHAHRRFSTAAERFRIIDL